MNDLDMSRWKELTNILTSSLWHFAKRAKIGSHKNTYHGNFIPQIPYQLIQRFTQKEDTIIDPFTGHGTTHTQRLKDVDVIVLALNY